MKLLALRASPACCRCVAHALGVAVPCIDSVGALIWAVVYKAEVGAGEAARYMHPIAVHTAAAAATFHEASWLCPFPEDGWSGIASRSMEI